MGKRIRLMLDEVLAERGMKRYELSKLADTHYNVIDKYYKNEIVRYDSDVLLRICLALNCEVGDIVKVVDVLDVIDISEPQKIVEIESNM